MYDGCSGKTRRHSPRRTMCSRAHHTTQHNSACTRLEGVCPPCGAPGCRRPSPAVAGARYLITHTAAAGTAASAEHATQAELRTFPTACRVAAAAAAPPGTARPGAGAGPVWCGVRARLCPVPLQDARRCAGCRAAVGSTPGRQSCAVLAWGVLHGVWAVVACVGVRAVQSPRRAACLPGGGTAGICGASRAWGRRRLGCHAHARPRRTGSCLVCATRVVLLPECPPRPVYGVRWCWVAWREENAYGAGGWRTVLPLGRHGTSLASRPNPLHRTNLASRQKTKEKKTHSTLHLTHCLCPVSHQSPRSSCFLHSRPTSQHGQDRHQRVGSRVRQLGRGQGQAHPHRLNHTLFEPLIPIPPPPTTLELT